jgi:ATP-dependent RNA helicase RhlE
MSFESLGLPNYLLKAVEHRFYAKPTPVQEQAIPLIQAGHDIIAEAQTGTGKTAAFALPIIQQLNELPSKRKRYHTFALVLVPTRELAVQVAKACREYAKFAPRGIQVRAIIGGENIEHQANAMRKGADIVVATPGRLLDLLARKELRLAQLRTLVLDEADKMLDLGFSEQLHDLLAALPAKRQNLLFSATLPEKVIALSELVLCEARKLQIEGAARAVAAIQQRAIEVDRINRRPLLQQLIKKEKWRYAMVFVASKKAARNLSIKLQKAGIAAGAFHGDLTQDVRSRVLSQFRAHEIRVLISTDIAARGIDIIKLSHVVNYDLPRSPKTYIHRIGRTGRAGESGVAISFIGHEDQDHFRLIEKRAGIRLEREQVPGFELTGSPPPKQKGAPPVKGTRKSKKDKLREQAAQEAALGAEG